MMNSELIDIPELTKAQRWSVINHLPLDGFTLIDICGVELGRDRDDLDVYLAVIKRESDGQLFGVPWGQSPQSDTAGGWSDECINDILPLVPLWAKTVTVYEGAGQSLLSELDVQL